MTHIIETKTMIYSHGTYFRKGDRIYVTCVGLKLILPDGITVDLLGGVGTIRRSDGRIHFNARVTGWTNASNIHEWAIVDNPHLL